MASKEKLQNGKVSDIQSLRQNCNYGRIKWSMVRKCIVIYVVFSMQYPLVRGHWLTATEEREDQTCAGNQDIEKLYKVTKDLQNNINNCNEQFLKYKETTDLTIKSLSMRMDEMYTALEKTVKTHSGEISSFGEREDKQDKIVTGLEARVNTHDGSISGLDERVNTHDSSISGLEEKVNTHDGSISGLEGRVNKQDKNISSLEGRLKTHDGSITGLEKRMNTQDGSISGLEGRVNKHDGSLSGLEGRVNTHDGSISGFERKVNTHDESIIGLEGRVNSHDGKINDTISRLDSHQTMTDEQSNDLKERISKANENLNVTEEKIKKMTDLLTNHDKDLMTAFENLFNKEVAMVVIGLILFMNFGLIIAVYSLCQSRPRQLGRPVYAAHNTGPDNTYYNPVLDMIPVGPKLRKSVGVISFTREYQPTHRHLLSSVTEAMDDIEYHVILTDDDIPDIPLCSLIVICIEYSDRDVIIEERGYGLGDCNKTTLAAAEKIGAIPVIIYCKDLSSQRLSHDRLYNPRIRCATHQMELIPLSSDNRFFSVYEDFSATQKKAFRKLIGDHVRPK